MADLLRAARASLRVGRYPSAPGGPRAELAVTELWAGCPASLTLEVSPIGGQDLYGLAKMWEQALPSIKVSVRLTIDGKVVPHSKKSFPNCHDGELVLAVSVQESVIALRTAVVIAVDERYFGATASLDLVLNFESSDASFFRKFSSDPLEGSLRWLVDSAYHGSPRAPEESWTCKVRFGYPLSLVTRVDEIAPTASLVTVHVRNIDFDHALRIAETDFQVAQARVDYEEEEEANNGSSVSNDPSAGAGLAAGSSVPSQVSSLGGATQRVHSACKCTPVVVPAGCELLPRQSKTFVFRVEVAADGEWTVAWARSVMGFFVCPFVLAWELTGDSTCTRHSLEHLVAWTLGTRSRNLQASPQSRLQAHLAAAGSAADGSTPALAVQVHAPQVVRRLAAFVVIVELLNQGPGDLVGVSMRTAPAAPSGEVLLFQQSSVALGTLAVGQRRRVELGAVALAAGVATLVGLTVVGLVEAANSSSGAATASSDVAAHSKPSGVAVSIATAAKASTRKRRDPRTPRVESDKVRASVAFESVLPVEILVLEHD